MDGNLQRCYLVRVYGARSEVAAITIYLWHVADANLHAGGQAFVQCGISKQARASNEVALVHSSLSAIAINSFISSLELKGTSALTANLKQNIFVLLFSNREAREGLGSLVSYYHLIYN